MERFSLCACLAAAVVVCCGSVVFAGDPNPSAYDTVIADFQPKGAFGAIVKVGYSNDTTRVRVGAAAKIGVTPDSYNVYRFALYVSSRDEAGNVVAQNASVMQQPLANGDPDRTGVYVNHANPKPGTYVITSVLTAIAKDGSVTVIDKGKSTTYTVK
jgi:hypothetical protein